MADQPRLVTLDFDDESRDALTLRVLEAVGEGEGRKAEACRAAHKAFEASLANGEGRSKARSEARATLHKMMLGGG